MKSVSQDWDFWGYWNVVLGDTRSADTVVREFELDPTDRAGLDTWLATAEQEACRIGLMELPASWSEFHTRALDELCKVAPLRMTYRLVIGELGNEQGHIVGPFDHYFAVNDAMESETARYQGHCWTRIEYKRPGGWDKL